MSETTEGFLRLPNDWIDRAMPTMGHAELKVVLVVVRQTIGWHKERDVISLTQFEEKTGLTRSNVMRGIRDAVNHKWIRAWKQGNRSLYEPCIADGIASIPETNSTVAVPEMVLKQYHDGIESVPKVVSKQYTQKKGKTPNKDKGKTISIGASARDGESATPVVVPVVQEETQTPEIDWFADDPPAVQPTTEIDWFADDPPAAAKPVEAAPVAEAETDSATVLKRVRRAKRELSEHEAKRHQELFGGIARICVLDPKLRSCAGQIARTAKELREADASATDATMTEFLEWWKTSDFRGRMGKPPTPQQVVTSWKLFRENYAERPMNGGKPQKGEYFNTITNIYTEALDG